MLKTLAYTIAILMGLSFSSTAAGNVETQAGPFAAAAVADESLQQWRFRVLLGKREIGFHEFNVNSRGDQTEVEINAEFDVKVLFINAYSYSHQNEEIWRKDCLSSLESVTDDNGQALSVIGERDARGFVVETPADRYEDDSACLRSFAYWNPAFLDSTRLLNSQTGEIVEVQITEEGNEAFDFDGETIAATRYAVEMEDGTISLWYARDNGQWLALEAPAPGGRVLRYEPLELPFTVQSPDKLVQN